MTRARTLKSVIRARIAKTGERYTTARRQVLAARASARATPPPAAPTAPPVRSATSSARGAVSEARVRERTGHGLDHWFAVLDRFGAVAQGHTKAARHLREVHGVDGWYSQGITVSYERARGLRAVNQRVGGDFEVSASKVVAAPPGAVVDALGRPRRRAAWSAEVDPALVAALAAAFAPPSKGFVIRPDGLARFRHKWGATTVQWYVEPRAGGKSTITVANARLADAAMVDTRRRQWRAALTALATWLASQD
ncbi:MAG: hypothetical protein AB7U83_15345 [Vicinamibacterales bacterium]